MNHNLLYKDKNFHCNHDANINLGKKKKIDVNGIFWHAAIISRQSFPCYTFRVTNALFKSHRTKLCQKRSDSVWMCPQGFYFYGHRCRPPSCFVLLFEPDAIGVLCSTDEESPYLLLCLKERQRWIDIDSRRWRLRSVVSRVGTCPTFSTFFPSPADRNGMLSLHWWIYSTKSLTVHHFFFTFVSHFVPFAILSLSICFAPLTEHFFYRKVLKDLKLLLFLQMAVIILKIPSAWNMSYKLLKVP